MRLFKIFTALLLLPLSVMAASSVWTGKVAEKFQYGKGKVEDPYLIKTPEEFALMAKKYADSAYYRLAEDIVLNEGDAKDWAKTAPKNKWTVYGDTAKFARVHLDGEGHSISGLYINSDKDYQGLFGAWTGVVANVKIKNSYVKGRNYVGTLAGVFGSEEPWNHYSDYNPFGNKRQGNIENVNADIFVEGRNFVGGLAGLLNISKATIDSYSRVSFEKKIRNPSDRLYLFDLFVSGSVQADSVVGGVFGGHVANVDICIGLWNKASVTGTFAVGGVWGYLYLYDRSTPKIFVNSGVVKGVRKVAGIIGALAYGESTSLENLSNLGAVSGESRVAGLVNFDFSRIRYVRNSYNAGKITGDSVVSPLFYNDDSCSRECLDTLHVYDLSSEHADSVREYADSMGAYFFPDTGASPVNKGLPVSAYFYPEKIYSHGSGSRDDPFLIAGIDDLRRFERHAEMMYFLHRLNYNFYRQTADIVFPKENNEWTPVSASNIAYDGGGHSISGFAIHNARLELDSSTLFRIDQSNGTYDYLDKYPGATSCTGFFKWLGNSTIDNLKLKDIYVEGDFIVGGLVGCFTSSDNKVVLSRISVDGSVKGVLNVGGFAGLGDGSFFDIANYAAVSGRKYVSGVANRNRSFNGNYLFVRNYGKVTGNAYVAGISSRWEIEGHSNSYFYNRGDIVAQEGPAGGLVAEASTLFDSSGFANSYNASNVTAESNYGALYGVFKISGDWKKILDPMMLYDKDLMSDPRNIYLIVKGKDSSLVSDAAFAAVDSKTLKSAGAKELGTYYGADENNENGGYPVFKLLKGEGTSESPYLIETADDLWKLKDLMNIDLRLPKHYVNSHYKLVADIDMKSSAKRPWIPLTLGVWGVFDGGGHTISGIYVDSIIGNPLVDSWGGLFDHNYGTIKNLGVADSHIYGTFAGAIVGENAGVIENCWNKNAIVEAKKYAGGIAGVMNPGYINALYMMPGDPMEDYQAIANQEVFINKAYNGGTVRSDSYSGGIVGGILTEKYYEGKIIRKNRNVRVANSYNVGKAHAGIVGQISYLYTGVVDIKNVYNADVGGGRPAIFGLGHVNIVNAYYVEKNDKDSSDFGTPMTAKEMKTKDFAKKMGEAFKYDANGVNNGFPIFSDSRGFDPDEPFSIKQQPLVYKALQVSVSGREIRLDNMIEDVNTALFDLRGKRVWSGAGKSAVIPVQKAGVYIVRNRFQMAKIVVR